jgi:UDP-glucose 4-epimerase
VVFGGSGFIGLAVAEHLLQRGSAVTVFDANPIPPQAFGYLSSLPGDLVFVLGDIRDPAMIERAFDEKVDGVVYGTAVTADAKRDANDPELIIQVNLVGFIGALRAARDSGVRRVVNLSSVGAYGDAAFGDGLLNEEATRADPVSFYALTKFGSERAGARLADLWDMDVRSVRLSGIFGPWERKTDVRDTPSPHFQVMRQALKGEPALFSRSEGRDWTYAADAAAAVAAVLDAPNPDHALYNIASGAVVSALEWGRRLAALRPGFECRRCEAGEAPTIDLYGPVDRQPMDIERLTTDFGFVPRFDAYQSVEDYDAWARGNRWAFEE